MAGRLIGEVIAYLRGHPDVSTAERLVLLLIADRAPERTRLAYAGRRTDADRWDLAQLAGLTDSGLRKVVQRLAARGVDVRVAHSWDKNGQPLYAHKGMQATYCLPPLGGPDGSPLDTEGGTDGPPSGDPKGGTGGRKGGTGGRKGGTGGRKGGTGGRKGGPPVPPYPLIERSETLNNTDTDAPARRAHSRHAVRTIAEAAARRAAARRDEEARRVAAIWDEGMTAGRGDNP